MIVRSAAVRALLRAHGAPQVSEDAVVTLAATVEEFAERLAQESVRVLHSHNEARILQRLEPLSRVSGEHVKRALEKSHAKR